jgi:peptidyl-prolyl cis-trans isomerase SurA
MRSDANPGRARARGVAAAALVLALAALASAEIIDRIVAVVNGSVITLSDVEAARRFGLIEVEGADLRGAVERTIDRRLALAEVERYSPPEPSPARLDEVMAAARARFPSGAAFDAALKETGLTADQLRRHLRDGLRLRTYEEQRFGFAIQHREEDLRAFFQANPDRFRRGGAPAAFEDVRAEVRTALIEQRTAQGIQEWIAGLRRRAEIRILAQ